MHHYYTYLFKCTNVCHKWLQNNINPIFFNNICWHKSNQLNTIKGGTKGGMQIAKSIVDNCYIMEISNICNNDHFGMCAHAYRAHEWLPLNLKDCKPLNSRSTNEFAEHEDQLQRLDESHHSNHEVLYHMIDDLVVPIII